MAARKGWKDRRRISKQLSHEAWTVYSGNEPLRKFARHAFVWGAVLGFATFIVGAAIAGLGFRVEKYLAIVGVVPLFLGSWVTAYVVYRYSAAITAETASVFDGQGASFDRGLEVASRRSKALWRWALIQVIVGWLLSAAREASNDNAIAQIVVAIIILVIGMVWGLITFFVLPVIIFENTGAIDAIKRSKDIAKSQWGKQIRGVVRISLRGAVVFILPGLLVVAIGAAMIALSGGNPGLIVGGGVVAAVGIVLVIIGSIRVLAARLIFGVALYRFATRGEDEHGGALGPFDVEAVSGAVRVR